MHGERPFLTARWTDLLMLNFAVPPAVVARLAPPGTEPDLYHGRAYASVVGFLFRDTAVLGIPLPGHQRFEEVNLRYYVRRQVGNEVRRGVVFVREITNRPAVTAAARWIYHENYVTRRMRSDRRANGDTLAIGDGLGYEWRSGSWGNRRWNRVAGRVVEPLEFPKHGSLTEFIVEHYWGHVHGRDGVTREYRVEHPPWRVAPADAVAWDCDIATTYGDSPLAEFLASPPESAFVADGSTVAVFRGHVVDDDRRSSTAPRLPQHAEVNRCTV